MSVRFEEPRAQIVSRGELRRAARSNQCLEVEQLLANTASPTETQWIVVGEVISARTVVRIRRAKGGGQIYPLHSLSPNA
jgi:hypothetical protein